MSKTMSEKELNGVTFYFVRNENYYMAKICNDIDIKAGIEEVTFEFDKIGNYELMDNKKVFPEFKSEYSFISRGVREQSVCIWGAG